MLHQLFVAAGHFAIFLVPALLLAGIAIGTPSLAFAVVMLLFPLMRAVFGTVAPSAQVLWHERVSAVLDRLPALYGLALVPALAFVVRHLALESPDPAHAAGLTLSLWMTLLFATCVAHDLIHRRSSAQALLGNMLAGLTGYPVLAQEHLAHHARPGDTRRADWPRVDESVWRFALRRLRRILGDAYGSGSAIWNPHDHRRAVTGLRLATLVSALTALAFALGGGPIALVVYLAAALAVAFGVQVITYLQHWGLGDDRQHGGLSGRAWEDDCRFQAWVTLGISLHDSHHRQSQRPYYRVALAPDSPRLPAGYVVLMVLCLFPRLWHKLMRPVLEHWERNPHRPPSAGRRLTCFSLYAPQDPAVSR